MSRLTLEQVKTAVDGFQFQEEEVEVPELGGSILLRQLSAGGQGDLLDGLIDPETESIRSFKEFAARQLAKACVDPPMSVDEARDFLERTPANIFAPIREAITKLNGSDPAAVKRAAENTFPDEG